MAQTETLLSKDQPLVLKAVDLEALRRFAGDLAQHLRKGDVIALHGDLGAGKTTFAQMLISAFAGSKPVEVVSPTFALGLPYELPRSRVVHFDLYRLSSADELTEIGFFDALDTAITIIEWPDRAGEDLPCNRLDIRFGETGESITRNLTLQPQSDGWAKRLARVVAMRDFLTVASWSEGDVSYLQGDASVRAYATITSVGSQTAKHSAKQADNQAGRQAILMDWPAQPDGPPLRDGKTYSDIAHLAESVAPFVDIAAALANAGIAVPEIYASDAANGFVLLEDLGNALYWSPDPDFTNCDELRYRAAVDVLVHLSQHTPPSGLLKSFDGDAQSIEIELLPDWYWPHVKGEVATGAARASFASVWQPLLEVARNNANHWMLRDYHSPNLLWLPDREGISRVGVIDFQDALVGHAAFDLVSLLQDARQTVPEDKEAKLLDHYCNERSSIEPGFDAAEFRRAYAILGAQRNTKILGIFARLHRRDNKSAYLAHIPRIWEYLGRDLAHPALAELKGWYDTHFPPASRETSKLDTPQREATV